MIALAIVVVFFIWPHIDSHVPRMLRRWAGTAFALLCLLPYFCWEAIFPPRFDVTAYSESVDYEFADSRYAEEFAELNTNAAWVKIDSL
jgi:hypothetical protein